MDAELRRYQQADVVRQQQQLGELQRQLEKANRDALEEHRRTVSDRYRMEFVTELRSVEKQIEVLKQAHASDDALKALQDELSKIGQRRMNSILICSNNDWLT
eukprot:1187370-Amphidinium_carterae.1